MARVPSPTSAAISGKDGEDDTYGVPKGGLPPPQGSAVLADMINEQSELLGQQDTSFRRYKEELHHRPAGRPSPPPNSPLERPADGTGPAAAAPLPPSTDVGSAAGAAASLLSDQEAVCRPLAAGEHGRAGRLYAWGKAGGKGGDSLPVADSAVDSAGDCCFPVPCIFPGVRRGREPRFVRAGADQGVFAALAEGGAVWAWSSHSAKGVIPALPPQEVLQGARDCAVGTGFVVAVAGDGRVLLGGEPRAPLPKPAGTGWLELEWGGGGGGEAAGVDACANSVGAALPDGSLWTAGSGPLGHGDESARLQRVDGVPPVHSFSLGSIHAAAAARDGTLWVWGDGLSGNLGTGDRRSHAKPVQVQLPSPARGVGCTRGQVAPKRMGSFRTFKAGQEGPRTHVVTDDGRLWIAGTTHKGMGADHISKTLQPSHDHLEFYCVGGKAADSKDPICYTGAAEDFREDPELAQRRMACGDAGFSARGHTGYLSGCAVVSSVPCHIHSVALSADGRAFAWGCGSDGRTGLRAYMRGPGGSKRTLKCYVSTPSQIEALEDRPVYCISAGRWYSVAIVGDPPQGGGASKISGTGSAPPSRRTSAASPGRRTSTKHVSPQ